MPPENRRLRGLVYASMFGTAQLCAVAHLSWRKALMVGVMPFLPGDALKAAALILVFARVRKRLLALSGGGAS